jgi:hypothetical protein
MPNSQSTSTTATMLPREIGMYISKHLVRPLFLTLLVGLAKSSPKARGRTTVGLDQCRARFVCRSRLHSLYIANETNPTPALLVLVTRRTKSTFSRFTSKRDSHRTGSTRGLSNATRVRLKRVLRVSPTEFARSMVFVIHGTKLA